MEHREETGQKSSLQALEVQSLLGREWQSTKAQITQKETEILLID